MPHFSGADVDIIVPTFNRSRYIGETLRSLLSQTEAGARILVIDDGSTDDTEATVARLGSDVTYLQKTNGGKATALNVALRQCSRALIWIFDDDDVAKPDALRRMLDRMNAEPACDFVYGSYERFEDDPAGVRTIEPVFVPPVSADGLFVALMQRCFILQCAMLVRRACYDTVGPFNEEYSRSQDYEMLLRLAQRFRGAPVEGVLFQQRQHSGARGTLAAPVAGAKIEEAWSAFDRRIAAELRERLSLRDYHPDRERFSLDPAGERAALLNMFVTYARKDRWDYATEDFAAFLRSAAQSGSATLQPSETALLQTVFDWYSRALRSFGDARAFRSLLHGQAEPSLVRACRRALAFPLHYRLRLAIRRRSVDELRQAWKALAQLQGAAHAAAALLGVLMRVVIHKRFSGHAAPPSELDIIQGRA